MATIKKFEDLNSWQKARELCQLIFERLIDNSEVRDFELINQINRSSGSVMDNIAEGFERNGNKEFNQFLSIAKASCGEVRSQLYRAKDRRYLTETEFSEMHEMTEETSKMISGLMNYLRNSDLRGIKFSSKGSQNEKTLNKKL
ncbi:four helix bundle protein [Ekhidna sp.]|uniref:four helix bundle protein n=1 Tax=Ekhidna sp. TaxID=2608089 RepID=UPI003C79B288